MKRLDWHNTHLLRSEYLILVASTACHRSTKSGAGLIIQTGSVNLSAYSRHLRPAHTQEFQSFPLFKAMTWDKEDEKPGSMKSLAKLKPWPEITASSAELEL